VTVGSGLSLVLFGGFQARLGSGEPLTVSHAKAQALLAYLAVRPGRRHPRDKLATLLWPGTADEHARQSLRQTLVRLRQALGPAATLAADQQEVAIEAAGLDVDVVRFEALIRTGSPEALEAAAVLYGGDLLDGTRVKEPPFDEWLLGERERLRELALQALDRLLEIQSGSGSVGAAIRTAMRMLGLDPAREAVHRHLMQLFQRQGRRAEALRQYRLCVDALQRELGVEPELPTRRLYQELVRAGRAASAPSDTRRLFSAPVSDPAESARVASSSSRLAAAPPPDPTPLIGRAPEMRVMRRALESMMHGEGRLVLVVGEAGIGKSRLVEAVEAEARERGVFCHPGRSYLSEQALPFAPWIEALRAGDVTGQPGILTALGPAWVEELTRLLPDLAPARPEGSSRDTGGAQQLFEAVARLVSCLAAERPRLIVLEDVHWADDMSLRLLAFVGRRIRGTCALLVATAREEELDGDTTLSRVLDELGDDPGAERIMLAPLSRDDTASLVRSLASPTMDAQATARLTERIFAASGGNPFMVFETIRAMTDGAGGDPSTGSSLPERVRQVIAGRLARLGDRSRRLLATAAVIGREFDFRLLQAASELPEATAAEEVETLVRRRILRVLGERFDFVHDQVREVVHDQLLPPRRTLLHAAVVRAIERTHAGELDEVVERLAHHAFRGELWEEAVQYGQRAGNVAAERSASAQAGVCFDQAFAALARLPESRERLAQAIQLRKLRGAHHVALGERDAYLRCSEEVVRLAERLEDDSTLASMLAVRTNALWFAGDNRGALEAGSRAVALSNAAGDRISQIGAHVNLGLVCVSAGEHRRAVGLLSRGLELLHPDLERDRLGRTLYPAVNTRGELARSQAELGEFAAAEETLREAVRIADALAHATTSQVLKLDICHVRLCRGDFPDAIPVLETCLAAFRVAAFPTWSSAAAAQLGYALAMSRRVGEGIPLLREAIEQVAQGRRSREALFLTYLAEARLLAHDTEEASTVAGQALELSRERFEQATEARALYLLGRIDGEKRDGEAESHLTGAMALAGELGLRPLVAQCRLALGELCRRAGNAAAAQTHLAAATTMLLDMGMPRWLEQAHAAGDRDAAT
jgi:DNA-binding SARP family transcriptional activator